MRSVRQELEDALLDALRAAFIRDPQLTLSEVEAIVPVAYRAARAAFVGEIRTALDVARVTERDEGAEWIDERAKR